MRIIHFEIRTPVIGLLAILISFGACKKNATSKGGNGGDYPLKTDSNYNPVDPAVPGTIGFFQDAWTGRIFATPAADTVGTPGTLEATDSLTIDVNKVLVKTSPYLFGNNSNLWTGQMVTQSLLMQYITDLSPNIIRAPAGSVSDAYFFNGTDAHKRPADAPDSVLDASGAKVAIGTWYGGNAQSNTLSLANYYRCWRKPGAPVS